MNCPTLSAARDGLAPTTFRSAAPFGRLAISLAMATLLHAASARASEVPTAAPTAEIRLAASAPATPDHGKMATEEATPVGGGAIEVELSYNPTFLNAGGGAFETSADAHTHALSLGVFYGLTEHLDLKVGMGFADTLDHNDLSGPTTGSGGTDLVIGTRWRFLADPGRALDLCFATSLVAPTGSEGDAHGLGLTQGYWSLRNALVASQDWGRTTANAELALTLPVSSGAGDLVGSVGANLAVGRAFSWLQPFAELNYEAARDAVTAQRLALTAGLNMTSGSGNRLLLGVQQAVWGRNVQQSTAVVVAAKTAF
jgi:hypothetical protein